MVNDSAGVDVILEDKSQRAAAAEGFRAAVSIEAERGLCNTPTLISSSDEFLRVFGNPSIDRFGLASAEAYLLAQNGVPMVVSRAKNPSAPSSASMFGCINVTVENGVLTPVAVGARAIATPAVDNMCSIFFKGEGTYCEKKVPVVTADGESYGNNTNVVLRFAKAPTQSAYAKEKQVFQLQVFDFMGATHIDQDTPGILRLVPTFDGIIDDSGNFVADGYGSVSPKEGGVAEVVAFVNGKRGSTTYEEDDSIYDAIVAAVKAAGLSDFEYSSTTKEFIVGAGSRNCFELSISISITYDGTATVLDGGTATGAFLSYPAGNVRITPTSATTSDISYVLATNLVLANRDTYMYVGDNHDYWASFYSSYLVETHTASLSYDDMDGSGMPMQLDGILAGSNYLVSRTSEVFGEYSAFGEDGDSSSESPGGLGSINYFPLEGVISANEIPAPQRSYAYAVALKQILGENLIRWRCVATPNLGDVITSADFVDCINAANETTLGISNIGKAASLNVEANLSGSHGNKFIADYSQYGLRMIGGRRTWVTFAALVTLLLHTNYTNGREARPPMGYNYGQITCQAVSEEITPPIRKKLAQTNKINTVISDNGYFLWEEVTSQKTDTSLSDVHNILSYCWMKYEIYASMKPFVAEYNDASTVADGLRVLRALNTSFITRNYIEEGLPNANRNVIGDKVMRFDFPVRFKGVARYVDVYVTAYSQTQSLEISIAEAV